jgi:hypothetical protein
VTTNGHLMYFIMLNIKFSYNFPNIWGTIASSFDYISVAYEEPNSYSQRPSGNSLR